ncbi:hypothetical protein LTS18_006362 [Coniosporium uncinatum]|uniref:Uncharacterized protein n=1 Tax=Coniosporium uncinatum TaxID=93489 RepID=A0ACC3DQM1_9PEZI|nr:hypothetical protein LTS18_006362 [Coniosporium uncinatum]
MAPHRPIGMALRLLEFASSCIVLGIMAYFIHRQRQYNAAPRGRTIYTLIVSIFGLLVSLIALAPAFHFKPIYPLDLLLSFAFFAAFGATNHWVNERGCYAGFLWAGVSRPNRCRKWTAAESFCFIAGFFFLCSAILVNSSSVVIELRRELMSRQSIYVYHRVRPREANAINGHANDVEATTENGAGQKKKGLFGRKNKAQI